MKTEGVISAIGMPDRDRYWIVIMPVMGLYWIVIYGTAAKNADCN